MEQDAMQGIMGLQGAAAPAQQPPMPNSQIIPEVSAEEMAAFERARQEIAPGEFANEVLRAGEEIDPAEVQELRQQLTAANLPMELILALLTMLEGLLAEPGRYAELRAELLAEGVPEDLLPEQFDGEFFGAMQLALEEMMAMQVQTPVPAFAEGGLASLKPIAKELQGYGRNGDTMLAHITPQEARMLQRMGGSGTINPVTGLREYFIGKVVKSIGNAVKSAGKAVVGAVKGIAKGVQKFVKTPVGKIVTAVALGYFLGPAAASMIGVSSTVGVAAVSGFVGGFGSSVLGGSSLKDSLISGATGAVLAGAGAGIMGGTEAFAAGSYSGPTTVSGQWEQLKSGVTNTFGGTPGGAEALPVDMSGPIQGTPLAPTSQGGTGLGVSVPAAPAAPTAPTLGSVTQPPQSLNIATPTAAPVTDPTMSVSGMQKLAQAGTQQGTQTGFFDNLTQKASDIFFPSTPSPVELAQIGTEAQKAAIQEAAAKGLTLSQNTLDQVYQSAVDKATPSFLRQYGPLTAAGLGVMSLTGGFDAQEGTEPTLFDPSVTGQTLLQQNPEQYGVQLGPVQTIYAQPQARPVEEEYADYYAAMAQNPYMQQPAQMQSPMAMSTMPMPYDSYAPRMLAQGGEANPQDFPRRNGAINGPGTGTSDSIPAMLSDGEFVFTARAVRGAGNGSRRDGAKRMYQMMKQFERNA